MSKAPTIRSVSHSISIETKNHAMPSVITAIGSVTSFRIGFRIVFRSPKTSAAQTSVQKESLKLTPLRTQPAMPSATAFAAHEANSHLITGRSYCVEPRRCSSPRDERGGFDIEQVFV